MKIIAIIPARMAATRFPGKPLAPIMGLPMIEHVRRRVELSNFIHEAIVATCDLAILEAVQGFGGKAVMTKDSHERCTDRIAEAALAVDADVVINVQGDEPLIMPEMLEQVARPLLEHPDLPAVNLVTRIIDEEEFHNPNAPKVVTDKWSDILYISREPIPSRKKAENDNYLKLKQLGIIAFKSDFLQVFTRLEPTPLEIIESVDMMRAIEHGYKIRAVQTSGRMIGVDVPGDIPLVEAALANDPLFTRYK